MKQCKGWILLLLAMIVFQSNAEEVNTSTSAPEKLTFSYTSHPIVDAVLLPLVQQAYQNLGIEVEFVAVESQRAQQLLKDGLVDGDVARISAVANRIPNIVSVALLDKLSLSLRCRPDIQCNIEDVNNAQLRIFMASSRATLTLLDLNYKAELYPLRDWNQINVMYQQNKIERFLWIEGTLASSPVVDDAVILPLESKPLEIYHILQKSHAYLAPKVVKQLELLLAAYRAEHALAPIFPAPVSDPQ